MQAKSGEPGVTAKKPGVSLRHYADADEAAAIELWRRTWQAAYPGIDFAARLEWWRGRWRGELVPSAEIVLAVAGDELAGFVTVDPRTGYLDQIVVAPERWGSDTAALLLAEAKRISPAGLDLDVNTDNDRAIRFYTKQGFVVSSAGTNPISGKPVQRMSWRP
jgi:putative acetyltransferase